MNPKFKKKLEEMAKLPFGEKEDCECGYNDKYDCPNDRLIITDSDREKINYPEEMKYNCYASMEDKISCVLNRELRIGCFCLYVKSEGDK